MKRRSLIKGILSALGVSVTGAEVLKGEIAPFHTEVWPHPPVTLPPSLNPMHGIKTYMGMRPMTIPISRDGEFVKTIPSHTMVEIPIEHHPLFSHFDDNGDPVLKHNEKCPRLNELGVFSEAFEDKHENENEWWKY